MKLATESVLSAADKSTYSRRGQPGRELAHGMGWEVYPTQLKPRIRRRWLETHKCRRLFFRLKENGEQGVNGDNSTN